MDLLSQIEIHGCYEPFPRRHSKASREMLLAGFCPLDFGSRFTFHAMPINVRLLLYLWPLLGMLESISVVTFSPTYIKFWLSPCIAVEAAVSVLLYLADAWTNYNFFAFASPVGQGGREWVKPGLSLCLFLNKSLLKIEKISSPSSGSWQLSGPGTQLQLHH